MKKIMKKKIGKRAHIIPDEVITFIIYLALIVAAGAAIYFIVKKFI